MNKLYYLYIHTRPDKNEVFYVGIGKNRQKGGLRTSYERAFTKNRNNKYWKNIVNKNSNYKIDIIFETDSKEEICNKEIELILFYGRKDLKTGTLCNLCSGGEGVNEMSEEGKKKLNEAYKKYIFSEKRLEHIKKIRINQGVPITILNIKGKFINNVDSLSTAAEITNTTPQNINSVLVGRNKSANNFIFVRTKDYNPSKDYSIIRNNGKYLQRKIEMYDKKDNLIKEFNNQKEIFKFFNKIVGGTISNCLKNKSKTAYGYKWKYKD